MKCGQPLVEIDNGMSALLGEMSLALYRISHGASSQLYYIKQSIFHIQCSIHLSYISHFEYRISNIKYCTKTKQYKSPFLTIINFMMSENGLVFSSSTVVLEIVATRYDIKKEIFRCRVIPYLYRLVQSEWRWLRLETSSCMAVEAVKGWGGSTIET